MLSVKENIDILLPPKQANEVVEEISKLDINVKSKFAKLSGGEQKLIYLIINLARDSYVLIIDEFENDLDVSKVTFIWHKIMSNTAHYIFIASHTKLNIKATGSFKIQSNQVNLILNDYVSTAKLKQLPNDTLKLKKNNLRSLSLYYKLQYVLVAILCAVLCIAVMLVSSSIFINLSMIQRVETTPFAENISVVTAPRYTADYAQRGTDEYLQQFEYGFDSQFIEELKRQKFVSNVEIAGMPNQIMSFFAIESQDKLLGLDIDKSIDYSKIDYNRYATDYEQTFNTKLTPKGYQNISFEQIIYPNKFVLTTPYYSQGQAQFWYGAIPAEESDEIAIDPYLAMYIATVENIELDELIGREQTVSINEYNSQLEVQRTTEKQFTISGIYMSGTNDILYSYHDGTEIRQANICVKPQRPQSISNCKDTFGVDYANQESQTKLETLELQNRPLSEYGQAISLYVETNSSKGEQQLYEYVKSISKYVSVDNNYARSLTTTNNKYKAFVVKNSIILALVGGLYLLLLLVIYNMLIVPKVNDINTLLFKYNIFDYNSLEKSARDKYNITITLISLIFGLILTSWRGMNVFTVFTIIFIFLIQLFFNIGLKIKRGQCENRA